MEGPKVKMSKLKFITVIFLTFGLMFMSLLILIFLAFGKVDNSYDVILATMWNRSGSQYHGLEQIVNKFNRSLKGLYKIKIKQVDSQKIDSIIGTGTLGVRKLPSLYISYGDPFLKYHRNLQLNQAGVKAYDLKTIIAQEQPIINEFIRETSYKKQLIVAPIGKSIDFMFINKLLVVQIFQALHLDNLANEILGNSKIEKPQLLKSLTFKQIHDNIQNEYNCLKKLKTLADFKQFITTWKNYEIFLKAAKVVLEFNQNEKIYLLGIDDTSSVAYAYYANELALKNYDSMAQKFIYNELETNDFLPTINANQKSKKILDQFLMTLQNLKRLAPRSYANYERFNGVRVRMTNNDYNSNYFAINEMIGMIGSSAGLRHLTRKKLKAQDILTLPVPGLKSAQFMMQQGPGIGMFELKDAQKNELAKAFVNYLTQSEINQEYAAFANYFPIHQASYQSNPDSKYFRILKKQANNSEFELIKQIFNYTSAKNISYQSVPISFEGNTFRYNIFDAALKNFLLDVNLDGIFSEKGIGVKDFWQILKVKAENQFSQKFIWNQT